jgi:3-hydroxybutyryl-CoA dehydrogenase
LSITKLASVTKRPQKVIGIHFMNPVPIMKLVEIVKGLNTDESTYRIAKSFAEGLGKVTITAHDNPGFIINYLLIPYLLDAIRAYENGIATKEDIDTGMKLGCGLPMGPLELADFIGLDTTMYIADAMYEEYREPRFAPPVLLRRMVTAGLLGRKSGKGFYDYSQKK